MGLEDALDGDAFVPGAGRRARTKPARAPREARRAKARDAGGEAGAGRERATPTTAAEAYARAFQAVLMAQTRALTTIARAERRENDGREAWDAREGDWRTRCGTCGDGICGRAGRSSATAEGRRRRRRAARSDDGDEDERTKSTTARFVKDRLPMVMSLGLLYLALARRRAAILPFELAKMAAEGSLPYLNVYDVVHEHCGENTVELLPSDEIFLFEHPKRIPTPQRIVAAAAFAAAKIDAQLPPINAAAILTRYVGTLFNLDSQVLHAARRTLSVYLSPALRYGAKNVVGAPESALLAYVVVALKFLYGLDGRTHTQGARSNFP